MNSKSDTKNLKKYRVTRKGNMEPAVSVIIPIYNSEKYLKECLDSVIKQTLSDMEIILVDDGSTDASGRICDLYAAQDARVRVFHIENGGLVAARKKGLQESRGEYIGYVDADDWIDRDMYSRMYTLAVQNDCDMIATGLYRQFSDSVVEVRNTLPSGFYNKRAIWNNIVPYMLYNGIYYQAGVRPNLCNKLVKKSLLLQNQMKVPENITHGEDVAVTYVSILQANTLYLSDDIYYHYRQHDSSICKAIGNEFEIYRIKTLYSYLKNMFCKDWGAAVMERQINTYISYVLVQRCFQIYDKKGKFFSAFGEIENVDKIAIYGAGNFGKQVYYYAVEHGMTPLWVDKRYLFYKEQGMKVEPIQTLLENDIDTILIAVMDETIQQKIKEELVQMGIRQEKLRWLDLQYITSEEQLAVLEDNIM